MKSRIEDMRMDKEKDTRYMKNTRGEMEIEI